VAGRRNLARLERRAAACNPWPQATVPAENGDLDRAHCSIRIALRFIRATIAKEMRMAATPPHVELGTPAPDFRLPATDVCY
jgi:hypothetical protein